MFVFSGPVTVSGLATIGANGTWDALNAGARGGENAAYATPGNSVSVARSNNEQIPG